MKSILKTLKGTVTGSVTYKGKEWTRIAGSGQVDVKGYVVSGSAQLGYEGSTWGTLSVDGKLGKAGAMKAALTRQSDGKTLLGTALDWSGSPVYEQVRNLDWSSDGARCDYTAKDACVAAASRPPPPPPPQFMILQGSSGGSGSGAGIGNRTSRASSCVVIGNCVMSGNVARGDYQYGSNERCSIRPLKHGYITATQFDTESCCDKLTINGYKVFKGSAGPWNEYVDQFSTIDWRSDVSVQRLIATW